MLQISVVQACPRNITGICFKQWDVADREAILEFLVKNISCGFSGPGVMEFVLWIKRQTWEPDSENYYIPNSIPPSLMVCEGLSTMLLNMPPSIDEATGIMIPISVQVIIWLLESGVWMKVKFPWFDPFHLKMVRPKGEPL